MPRHVLQAIRTFSGPRATQGLSDAVIERFLAHDPKLERAIEEAGARHAQVKEEFAEGLQGPEQNLVQLLQAGYLNFYPDHAVNPYVPLAARGPWIVTSHGAVLYDTGGYGMLGFGHGPDEVIDAMRKPWVIANIMTPSFSQKRFQDALRAEIGHTRGACPYAAFVCMNSGSEAVTVAARISDAHAKVATAPGGHAQGRKVAFLALEGGFHGRTDRPAQASGSCQKAYREHLASFRGRDNLVLVPPNDVTALQAAFERAEAQGVFFEMMFIEPVMGEGNPGVGMSREFYDRARVLCDRMGTLLLIDSIQAGLRAHACLSIVDYPGFEDAAPPDFETYSKALNAAQYPLSVLALGDRAARAYRIGIYGNTMTTNPRALEVGLATLQLLTPALRKNVRDRGAEFLAKLGQLRDAFPDVIKRVQGTGLLLSASLDPSIPVVGDDGIEKYCRLQGLGVIHGGENALRFTPHFRITSAEIDLVIDLLAEALTHYRSLAPAAE